MTDTLSFRRIWIALVAAPAAWAVQGLIGWGVGAFVCTRVPLDAGRGLLGALGAAAIGVSIASLLMGRANWRTAAREGLADDDGRGLLAFAGMFVGVVFVIATGWATLNAVLLGSCGVVR